MIRVLLALCAASAAVWTTPAMGQDMVSGCAEGTACMTESEAAYVTAVLQASIEARTNGLCHDAVVGLELAFVHYPDPRIEIMIAECLEEIGDPTQAAMRYRSVADGDNTDATSLAVERLAVLAPPLVRERGVSVGSGLRSSALGLTLVAAADERQATRVRRTRIALGTLFGATAALGGTSLGFALAADAANDDVRSYDPSAPGASREDLDRIEQRADRDARLSNVSLGVAAMTAGAAIGLLTGSRVGGVRDDNTHVLPVAGIDGNGFRVGMLVTF